MPPTHHTVLAVHPLRVLSVQSWVCHGYVGNRCSLFALQTLGAEVDTINTVQFSNHTGYSKWTGEILTGAQLMDLFEGLESNNLTNYTHLLTGYVNSPETLKNLMKIYTKLKATNPNLIYVCDPVMGDNGKLYVPETLVKIYSFLLQMDIRTQADALEAISRLHALGPSTVIISSLSLEEDPGHILVLGSTKFSDSTFQRFSMKVPKLNRTFTGTGDLFAALIVGWTGSGLSVMQAVERTVNTLQCVLRNTMESDSSELQLVQSRKQVETPPSVYTVSMLP